VDFGYQISEPQTWQRLALTVSLVVQWQ
jgi:hypothetical protein